MKMIVGLGNPGPRYKNTRHNVGFMVLDKLADALGAAFDKERHKSLIASARHNDEKLLLVKPLTFMNLSGEAVAAAGRNVLQEVSDLLVVVDDVNLPLGKLRIRTGGSAGGHNGLKSIIACMGTPEFPRLRIGVGSTEPGRDLRDHVLSSFHPDEWPEVRATVARAADAVLRFVEAGVDQTMNEFN
ncbi:MAG: aminoacyl-tRNA hydrolase [Candidatus Hydrogenedentes bacterium]|nr:aminoacyl-tRNA hydrolase [Candidatus Hydrogenedentota bacterium]